MDTHLVVRLLAGTAMILVLASIAGQLSTYVLGEDRVFGLVPLFDVDRERNVPTFFSALLLILSAQLLAAIGLMERGRPASQARYWATLSLGFLIMALDEISYLHEELSGPIRSLLGGGSLGIFFNAWVIGGMGLVLVFGVLFIRFLMRLAPATRRRLLVAGGLYVCGVIVMEVLDGAYAESHGATNLTYAMLVTIEESLEMAGIIVLIRALLLHLADGYGEIGLNLVPRRSA